MRLKMKKLVILAVMALCSISLFAKNNIKLKIEGPEEEYNMVRVVNKTSFSDFNLTIYSLKEDGEKLVVDSALGSYYLKGKDDIDSVRVRTKMGQWIGVALPDGMETVTALLTYVDLPLFDIVLVVLTEEAMQAGEEF